MTPTTDQLKDLMAKVTPAPWNVTTPVDDAPEFRVIQHGDYGHSDCGRYLHTSGQTSEADATLIALAPTLAAEVVRLREALTRIDSLTEESPFDFGLIRLIARQALDATSDA